jgi:cytochrome c oxidase subunit 1/cytochrome c oxidase subunit I+III
MGWTSSNLIESIGGAITTAGILLLFANLAVSYRRGPLATADPWHGPTLEWSIPSPPPEYNFAVIPVVRSAYPNWDVEDRAADRARLAAGVGVLDRGHEQIVSELVDGYPTEIATMPHSSPWPILLALAASGFFAVLVIQKYTVSLVFVVFAALVLLAWHSEEPE